MFFGEIYVFKILFFNPTAYEETFMNVTDLGTNQKLYYNRLDNKTT